MTDNKVIVFEGGAIRVTKEEYDTFVKSISTQSPTEAEVKLYLYDCDRRGVHPLDKLIHFTKRNGRYVPIVSIDYMRMRAESSGAYAGSYDAIFEEDEKFPKSARVSVWKMVEGQPCRFDGTARWDEYAPDLKDKSAFMWKKMPHTMLAKCAEALALRKAFPGHLHGLYSSEEMAQDARYIDVDASDSSDDGVQKAQNRPQNGSGATETESPASGMVETAEALSEGFTSKELRSNAGYIDTIKAQTGLSAPEILKVINGLEGKHTIGQVVKLLQETK